MHPVRCQHCKAAVASPQETAMPWGTWGTWDIHVGSGDSATERAEDGTHPIRLASFQMRFRTQDRLVIGRSHGTAKTKQPPVRLLTSAAR